MSQAPSRLRGARWLIDRIDAGIIALAQLRRLAVAHAARAKPAGFGRDAEREAEVRAHARHVAGDLGLPPAIADRLSTLLITDACALQGLDTDEGQGAIAADGAMLAAMNTRNWIDVLGGHLPPPRMLAPLVARIPAHWQVQALESAMSPVLDTAIGHGDLDFLEGRTIGIDVTDLQWSWQVGLRERRLRVVADRAEASIRGSATDLLQLAGRREDADTLFFQRRLVLTGDTELGLHARNVLDRLDWQVIPLPARIVLSRAARVAERCRAAYQARRAIVLPGP